MITKTREELRFKQSVTDGKFQWPKGGQASYLVRADRASTYRGKPSLRYNEGDAEPQNTFNVAIRVSAEELNEIGGNQYLRQAVQSFKNKLGTNLQWVTIGVLALIVCLDFYFGTDVSDRVEGIQAHLNAAHPPPPPQPTTAGVR